jgi:type I restriction enzyme S subunit
MPQTEMLKTFESTVKPIFLQIKILTNKNFNLNRTRDLLLPKLISGEIDVSNFTESVTD